MKKLGFILIACALILGTAQCKKNDETNKPENNGEPVFITLTVGGGTRSEVVPEDDIAPVYYAEGDMIHVVSDGKYIGTLTYNGSDFGGNITNPTEGEPLHFYFLGNVTPNESLIVGETTTCSVVISDQTTSHPVISYAPSTVNYSAGMTNYTATLLNKCALAKFNVTSVSENATCITGMNNKVTVDFEANEFEYSQEGDGIITLSAGEGEKWVILLPQDEVSQTEAHSADGLYTGTCASIPAIAENDYQVNGIVVAISHPMGAISGLFTINANGDQVYFSQGNLQYQPSTNTWRFAENQWDYVGCTDVFHVYGGSPSGTIDGSSNHLISLNYNGWVDYFGWGTSGWNNGNIYYHPYDSDFNDNFQNQGWGYGPTDGINYAYDLTGSFANSDWGIWNPIINGGNQLGFWRTISCDEFLYLLNGRNTSSGIYYVKALVNNINGMIILPDNWSANNYPLNNPNQNNVSFTSNNISSSIWTSVFESNGAVFLPAAGHRNGIIAYYPGDVGGYWLSTCYDNLNASHYYFNDTQATVYIVVYKYQGHSVRLIHDYNP